MAEQRPRPEEEITFVFDPRDGEARSIEEMKKRHPSEVQLRVGNVAANYGEVLYVQSALKVCLEFLGEESIKLLLGNIIPKQREQFGLPNRKLTISERAQFLGLGLLALTKTEPSDTAVVTIPPTIRAIIPSCCGLRINGDKTYKLSIVNPIKVPASGT